MKLKKGSAAAKAYMAKIRAKRNTKKVGEVATTKTGKPAKRLTKAQKEYNKDVDAYKYFVVVNGKIESGFEYKSDALDLANEFEPKAVVLSKKQLSSYPELKDFISRNKYTLGATEKVGSTLKLKANEKRLGATPKDIKGNGYHKDTKSHNVRISVMSGLGSIDYLHKEILATIRLIEEYERVIKGNNEYLKIIDSPFEKKKVRNQTAFFKSKLAYYKKALIQLKKLYNKK